MLVGRYTNFPNYDSIALNQIDKLQLQNYCFSPRIHNTFLSTHFFHSVMKSMSCYQQCSTPTPSHAQNLECPHSIVMFMWEKSYSIQYMCSSTISSFLAFFIVTTLLVLSLYQINPFIQYLSYIPYILSKLIPKHKAA